MQPIDAETLNRGWTYQRYRESVRRNGEVFDEVFRAPAFGADDVALLRRLPGLGVVAICEDWCPDVYHTLPTWARLAAELPGWQLRVFPLERHPGLIEPFLHRGRARRIPVYAFFDARGFLQTWWSGRGAVAQERLDGFLGGRTFSDLGTEEKDELGRRLDEAYRRELRRWNFLEILGLLKAFFHLS